jgi:hypothetical protein
MNRFPQLQKFKRGRFCRDAMLMRDMLVAGGAVSSEDQKGGPGPKRFGEAMAIYSKIFNASTVLSRDDVSPVAGSRVSRGSHVAAKDDSLWDDRSQVRNDRSFVPLL